MKFHQHSTNNMLLGAPPGMQNCDTMPATMTTEPEVIIASFWRPTEEELQVLNAGGSVVLHIFGTAHPPVALGVTPHE